MFFRDVLKISAGSAQFYTDGDGLISLASQMQSAAYPTDSTPAQVDVPQTKIEEEKNLGR